MNLGRGGKTYFSHRELACPTTGVVKLAPGFGEALIELRIKFAHPMTINSCCRSASHNREVGGHAHSLHVYDTPYHATGGTAAIDIAWPSPSFQRLDLLSLALAMGWSVGVAKWGMHFDRRDFARLPPMVFGYGG